MEKRKGHSTKGRKRRKPFQIMEIVREDLFRELSSTYSNRELPCDEIVAIQTPRIDLHSADILHRESMRAEIS
ncbi:hypothetical protein CEE69_27865 [Rhodopirellula bahusiensis]|uniref:Uncharacterized protein n=1 Tax=Rhodopirellula bahusiensis TaxID=2014065 RepID=A0A2G1VYW7_9BACT|nr:hypothetical protein CEE69_27865 [Rhodopirellula bahusiensis]